uniref:Uncharacterized protein n=1 Tax=Anguilla anguilla TaxID=7936 RepID=A0A0E9TGY7_ANGAN
MDVLFDWLYKWTLIINFVQHLPSSPLTLRFK